LKTRTGNSPRLCRAWRWNHAFNNLHGGLFNSGDFVDLGAGNVFANRGTLAPGGTGTIATTPLTGNLDQKAGGTFAVDVNMRNNTADRLNVSGTAVLRGKMVPDVLMLGRLHVFKSHRHGPLAGDSRERPLFVEQFRACGI
jgi:hypothetical protein